MVPADERRNLERPTNPYLGPRPFTQDDAYRFFGRDREASELYSLVTAHRTTLLYAESGAGKTSLLNAGLIPLLERGGFDVLPVARVSGRREEPLTRHTINNIYVLNCAEVWELGTGPPFGMRNGEIDDHKQPRLETTLTAALARRPQRIGPDGEALTRVAIIDQLEELFTTFPERWRDREGFFRQLDDAMAADPALRVLLAMREDFLANLDPFEDLLPEEFRTRYRLESLREKSALEAVENPLKRTGITFRLGVAELLVHDLLKMSPGGMSLERKSEDSRVDGDSKYVLGEFVEPVQLQVLCFSLFRNLPAGTTEISEDHLAAFGDVDQALRDFYQSALKEAATKAAVEEDSLREWFENELITESGSRGLVFRAETMTGGIPNAAVDALEELHIIRAEVRGRDRWYELSHDRFIQPILRANDAWRIRFQKAAAERREAENRRLVSKSKMALDWSYCNSDSYGRRCVTSPLRLSPEADRRGSGHGDQVCGCTGLADSPTCQRVGWCY